MSTTGKVFLGVLAGAAVGATLGILYAPDKGSNTRKKIAQGANDKAGELVDKFNGYVDRMSKELETAKDEVTNMVGKGKEEARNMVDKGKANVENTHKEFAAAVK